MTFSVVTLLQTLYVQPLGFLLALSKLEVRKWVHPSIEIKFP